jgi:hypothetical protein
VRDLASLPSSLRLSSVVGHPLAPPMASGGVAGHGPFAVAAAAALLGEGSGSACVAGGGDGGRSAAMSASRASTLGSCAGDDGAGGDSGEPASRASSQELDADLDPEQYSASESTPSSGEEEEDELSWQAGDSSAQARSVPQRGAGLWGLGGGGDAQRRQSVGSVTGGAYGGPPRIPRHSYHNHNHAGTGRQPTPVPAPLASCFSTQDLITMAMMPVVPVGAGASCPWTAPSGRLQGWKPNDSSDAVDSFAY